MIDISSDLLFMISLLIVVLIGILIVLLINKSEKVQQLSQSLEKLKQSFEELDEQAKLIVKTDLTLNKTQEELDKRLNSLDALQKTSRLISTTLDENEIFERLEQSLVAELGFEKILILLYDENKKLNCRVHLGFFHDEMAGILENLPKNIPLMNMLDKGQTLSSLNFPKDKKEAVVRIFEVEHFIFSPILTQNGIIGIAFVGNRSNASPITAGDEELVSILANQIGQSLENAQLFEQIFRSRQNLESKIQDRTKELASALDEVQKINKMKSEFMSAVSHELRTPLTSIKGYASLLMTGKLGDIPQEVKQRLEKINIHSDNLVKFINDLLDIARIESGRVDLTLEKCSLAALIENTHDLLIPQMKEKNIQWVSEIDTKLPSIFIDTNQVDRVFINLIGNAIKFTPTQGTIHVTAKKSNNDILVEISDTGIGIKEEDLSKIFNEFYRAENPINQNVKGTGLGLTLARKIIEAHGGKIWVTSKFNEGTTFHFTLPIVKEIDSSAVF